MAEWRIGRGWSERELEDRLNRAKSLPRNFLDSPARMTLENGWHYYHSEAVVAWERPGTPQPDGPFQRGRIVVSNYEFSDPAIVIAHFAPQDPLLGRTMLLEVRAFRVLHYLSGVVVGAVESETADGKTIFGFRYDTLEGHIEAGTEWFLLTKDHASGEIRLRIEASWRPGQFPNWWSRLGFFFVGPHYQKLWHHRAHSIAAQLMKDPTLQSPEPREGRLVHTTPEVIFKRKRGSHV
jgi:hypothetical protein